MKTETCLHCGKTFELKAKCNTLKYPYCYEHECQDAKEVFYKARNKKAQAKWKKEHPTYFKEYRQKRYESPEANGTPTGHICRICEEPIMVYKSDDSVTHENYYSCRRCREWLAMGWSIEGIQKHVGVYRPEPVTFSELNSLDNFMVIGSEMQHKGAERWETI